MKNTVLLNTERELKHFLKSNRPLLKSINGITFNRLYPMIEVTNNYASYYDVETQSNIFLKAPFEVQIKGAKAESLELLATGIETQESVGVSLYERHGFNEEGVFKIEYMTIDETTNEKLFYESSLNPEKLTDDQRYEILDYCLGQGMYHKDEIVSYLDIFIHGKYVNNLLKSQ